MNSLLSMTWDQVHAWRLSQHFLSRRLERQDYLKAVTSTCGIQSQVMSAAELALWARVEGLAREDVQSALWRDRTLVKTWAMRAALHLISARDLPLYVAARNAHETSIWLKYFEYFGIPKAQYEAFVAAVPQVLGGEPMTREQLAIAVAEHIRAPGLSRLLLSSSWGSLWKPSAWRGDLCFGPNQGRNVTFVNPRQWIGDWQPVEPYAALQEIARRYLRAYGPARPEDFALWWGGGFGFGIARAKKLFRSMEGELEEVDVEGWHGLALRTTLGPMQKLSTTEDRARHGTVQLLPLFDAYTLGVGRDIESLLPGAFKRQVYRPQGWISAVVLVHGRMAGVWEHKVQRSRTEVRVRMFSPPPPALIASIEAEAQRLGPFFHTEVTVRFEDS